jgi:hypothetical protein
MPRHELVSPEEDLAAFYGGTPPAPTGAAAGPEGAVPTPPPVPAATVPTATVPATPPSLVPTRSIVPPDLADLLGPDPESAPRPLAPVARPAPNFTEAPPAPVVAPPNVWLAALLSFLLPGVGQLYAGQTKKGAVLLLVAVGTCFGGGLLNFVAALDAFLIAQRKERGEAVGDWQFF